MKFFTEKLKSLNKQFVISGWQLMLLFFLIVLSVFVFEKEIAKYKNSEIKVFAQKNPKYPLLGSLLDVDLKEGSTPELLEKRTRRDKFCLRLLF
jgi:hypothetical protein